jgi:hypothetical protein
MSENKAAKVSEKKVEIPKMDPGCDLAAIDIIERTLPAKLLDLLLKDMTTGHNIIWGTDNYAIYGNDYKKGCQITRKLIAKKTNKDIIQPRILKEKCYQKERTKTHAEVFTPSWICNEMNNRCDEEWFGRKNVFNVMNPDNTWTSTTEPVFPTGSNKWRDYVRSKRIEITCGEAPYLVSPYDTTTGKIIPVEQRIGMLDRKLRVINENTNTEETWWKWVQIAYKSIYGYEYQGDNLLLARENLLWAFIDNYELKFKKKPSRKRQNTIAQIIAWNIWQMDGLTCCAPFSSESNDFYQMGLFGNDPLPCHIIDWENNLQLLFKDLKKDQQ